MFEQLKKLFTSPKEYWSEVVAAPGDIKSLLIPQMLILAAIPAISVFLGLFLGFARLSLAGAAGGAILALILSYGLNIGLWIGLGYIIDALAGSFSAQRDLGQSMKLAAGTVIPMWMGNILHLTTVSALGMVGSLAGLGYGAYVLYLGLPIMNGTPAEKAIGYTVVSVVILFVVGIVVGVIVNCPVGCIVASSILRGVR